MGRFIRLTGSGLTDSSIAAALAAKGLTDAQARSQIGSAATLSAGLRAVGLSVATTTGAASPQLTTTNLLIVAGQSQGMTPNTSPSTVPANIAAMPGATANTSGVRIYNPGTNAIEPYVAASNSYVYARNGANSFYGPEAELARLWLAANPNQQLTILKLNIGATPLQKGASFQNGTGGAANNTIIECWDPTLADDPNNATLANRNINAALLLKSYYSATISALQAEGKTTINRVGMFWLQGQNDGYFQATSQTYGTALSAFQSWARTNLLAGGNAPFVISMCELSSNWQYAAGVRSAQTDFASNQINSFTVETTDLPIGADGFHYSPAALTTLGGRAFAALSATHTPIITSKPSISGTTQTGSTLTGADAVWTGGGSVSARAWLLGGSAISGATAATYAPTQTGSFQFQETITNAGGSTITTSNAVTVTATAATSARPAGAIDLTMTSPTYGTGKFGQALTGGYGEGGKLASTPSLTLECWFQSSTAPSGLKIAFGQVGVAILGVDANGRANAYVSVGSNQVGLAKSTSSSICDGAWHHLEINTGPSGSQLYQDGVLIASNTTAFASLSPDFTQQPLSVRRCQVGTVGQYDTFGNVDEAAAWNVVRHTANFSVPTAAYAGTENGITNIYHLDGSGVD